MSHNVFGLRSPYEFKGVMLGVNHATGNDASPVDEVFAKVRAAIDQRKGKTLFIEGPRSVVNSCLEGGNVNLKGFEKIIRYANSCGMKVVGLDSDSMYSVSRKLQGMHGSGFRRHAESHLSGPLPEPVILAGLYNPAYGNKFLREKSWANALRASKKGDLVIAHPTHILSLARLVGAKGGRVRYLHPPERRLASWSRNPKAMRAFSAIRSIRREILNKKRAK